MIFDANVNFRDTFQHPSECLLHSSVLGRDKDLVSNIRFVHVACLQAVLLNTN